MTDNEILILSDNSGKIEKLSNSGSISKIGPTHFASVLDVKGERKEKVKDESHFVTEHQEEWSCPFLLWKVYRKSMSDYVCI